MTLEQFVTQLQLMLKNPNAIILHDRVIHVYTFAREIIVLNFRD